MKSRIAMHQAGASTVPYVKFDGYINFKPTTGMFTVYLSESGEKTEVKEVKGALITRRNIALASSPSDNPVQSQDFDSFSEKLMFREVVKGGKLIAKDLTYAEARDEQHRYFLSNSYRLGSVYYIVTEKG